MNEKTTIEFIQEKADLTHEGHKILIPCISIKYKIIQFVSC